MLFPIFTAVAIMALVIRRSQQQQFASKFVLAAGAGTLLIAAPVLARLLGAYDFDFKSLFQAVTAASALKASTDVEWSSNSIGLLLVPDGPVQALLFLVPRMIVNLLVPLTTRVVTLDDLVAGNWSEWQRLLTSLSAFINVLALPFVLASLVAAVRGRRQNPGPLAIQVAYWLAFLAVAGGNLVIVERYRVMVTPLFWACAWLGTRADARRFVPYASFAWFGTMALGVIFYMVFKVV
jgi:hypothetical protein